MSTRVQAQIGSGRPCPQSGLLAGHSCVKQLVVPVNPVTWLLYIEIISQLNLWGKRSDEKKEELKLKQDANEQTNSSNSPLSIASSQKFHTTSVDMAKVTLFFHSKADHVLNRGLGMPKSARCL